MLSFLNLVSRRLGKDEMQLLEDVYYQTKLEILFTEPCGKEIDEEVLKQIIDVTDDLVHITEWLIQCVEAKQQFLKNYPVFSQIRDKNVGGLVNLGKSLNLNRKNSNIARLVGNVTSFLGGSLVVASAALVPTTLGLSAPLGIAGASVVAAGSATSVGTSVTEIVLVKDKVKKAIAIIDEDKKALGDLISWLDPACDLAEALDGIFKIDLMRDMMEILREHIDQVIQIKQGGKRNKAVTMLVRAALVFLPGNLGNVVEFVAVLISMLSAIIMLHNRNRFIFDCASLTFKSAMAILSCVDICVDGGLTVAQLVSGNAAVAKSVGKAVIRGTFAAFSMTLDAASVILTSIDVHKGSKSKEALQIMEVADKLREQNEELRKVFVALRNGETT